MNINWNEVRISKFNRIIKFLFNEIFISEIHAILIEILSVVSPEIQDFLQNMEVKMNFCNWTSSGSGIPLGLVLVCTSNRSPDELYLNGLNRDRFLPFIPLLYENCDVFNLQSNEDFRQTASTSKLDHENVFFIKKDMDYLLEHYKLLNPNNNIKINIPLQITRLRSINIPYSNDNVAFFDFTDICGTKGSCDEIKIALGTDAYLKIANKFNIIYVNNVPQFDANSQLDGQLRSFMLFIDILYERNNKLLLSIEVPLLNLFGLYGIVKIANIFQSNMTNIKFPDNIMIEDFIKIGGDMNININDCIQLYNAMLGPDDKLLKYNKLLEIMDNHKNLMSGLPAKFSGLYKFDIKNDDAAENEFMCSRTLSRLFHMSSKDYLDKCPN